MSYYPEFARLIEAALMRQDRSPSWLAQRLGVHHGTVGRWLNQGARPRDPKTVVRIADILGLSSECQALLVAAGYGYQKSPDWSLPLDDTGIPRHSLPSPITSLVGRASEIAEIAEHLAAPECRLLTLWGLGGIGKTRLALAAAQAQMDSSLFLDGVYYVPLVPLSRPQQMAPAVAAAMHFPLDASGIDRRRSPTQQLLDFLRAKRLLLVLDNLEHLPEVGQLITDILEAAKDVKVLATSRERLRLPGEQVYPLAGLDYPAEEIDGDLRAYSALQLFLERARQTQPDFAPGDAETDDLVRICQVVDGMPLAIELAAAWVDALSLCEIRRELEVSLGFLATEAQGVQERHRSMEVAFGASWQRLTNKEQRTFARLSVFRGGFTREAAQQVAGATLMLLGSLAGKAFVRFQREQNRYDIHELMRQYGAERLLEQDGDEERTHDRHAAYFCALLQRGYEELKGSRQLEALAVLTAEQGNLQVAWEHAVSRHSLALVEQAMDGLGHLYEWTGNLTGGVAAFAAMAEGGSRQSSAHAWLVQAHALAWLANFELLSGHTDEAEQHLTQSLAILDELAAEDIDVRAERALALLYWGNLEMPRSIKKAVDAYHKSSALYADAGLRWEAVIVKSWLGKAHQILHDEQAGALLNEALLGLEEFGDTRSMARVLEDIAIYYMLNAVDLESCLDTIQVSLELRRESGDLLGISASLNTLGGAYCWLGKPEPALEALNEAMAIAQRLGHRAGECKIILDSVNAYNYLGDANQVQALAEQGLALARELGQARYSQYYLISLGYVALARKDYALAYDLHVQAFKVMEEAGIPVAEPWPNLLRAHSAWKVHRTNEAHKFVTSALCAILERKDVFNAVYALRFLALVLAGRGILERAVEIGAAARAVSRWDRAITARMVAIEPLEELTQSLSPEIAAAAREHGQARDVFEIASQLLEEVQSPDWRWE